MVRAASQTAIMLVATGRDAGVVERGGLENRCARKGTEGSNPSPSAKPSGFSSMNSGSVTIACETARILLALAARSGMQDLFPRQLIREAMGGHILLAAQEKEGL